jgi:hypothetical protein
MNKSCDEAQIVMFPSLGYKIGEKIDAENITEERQFKLEMYNNFFRYVFILKLEKYDDNYVLGEAGANLFDADFSFDRTFWIKLDDDKIVGIEISNGNFGQELCCNFEDDHYELLDKHFFQIIVPTISKRDKICKVELTELNYNEETDEFEW